MRVTPSLSAHTAPSAVGAPQQGAKEASDVDTYGSLQTERSEHMSAICPATNSPAKRWAALYKPNNRPGPGMHKDSQFIWNSAINDAKRFLILGAYEQADHCALLAVGMCKGQDPEALLLAGEAKLGLGRWNDAIYFYSMSLQLAPTNAIAQEGYVEATQRLVGSAPHQENPLA